MPRRPTHVMAGLGTGASVGMAISATLPERVKIPFAAGATLGGLIGGILPDWLEPADSPNHRGTCHSLVAALLLLAAFQAGWHLRCIENAKTCDANSFHLLLGSPQRAELERQAQLWALIAGFLAGGLAGYTSHLALDGATPRGLPFISASF